MVRCRCKRGAHKGRPADNHGELSLQKRGFNQVFLMRGKGISIAVAIHSLDPRLQGLVWQGDSLISDDPIRSVVRSVHRLPRIGNKEWWAVPTLRLFTRLIPTETT